MNALAPAPVDNSTSLIQTPTDDSAFPVMKSAPRAMKATLGQSCRGHKRSLCPGMPVDLTRKPFTSLIQLLEPVQEGSPTYCNLCICEMCRKFAKDCRGWEPAKGGHCNFHYSKENALVIKNDMPGLRVYLEAMISRTAFCDRPKLVREMGEVFAMHMPSQPPVPFLVLLDEMNSIYTKRAHTPLNRFEDLLIFQGDFFLKMLRTGAQTIELFSGMSNPPFCRPVADWIVKAYVECRVSREEVHSLIHDVKWATTKEGICGLIDTSLYENAVPWLLSNDSQFTSFRCVDIVKSYLELMVMTGTPRFSQLADKVTPDQIKLKEVFEYVQSFEKLRLKPAITTATATGTTPAPPAASADA